MSRTNPQKEKPKSAKRTLLMYGEGFSEEIFLKHLRKLYSHNSGVEVKIRKGSGGSATSIITKAVNEPGAFDRRIVILDNDKNAREMERAQAKAKRQGVELLKNTPCLEAVLLAILRPGENFSSETSTDYKKEFESNYLNKKERTDIKKYEKLFPKNTLDMQRANVPELNTIISLIE